MDYFMTIFILGMMAMGQWRAIVSPAKWTAAGNKENLTIHLATFTIQ